MDRELRNEQERFSFPPQKKVERVETLAKQKKQIVISFFTSHHVKKSLMCKAIKTAKLIFWLSFVIFDKTRTILLRLI